MFIGGDNYIPYALPPVESPEFDAVFNEWFDSQRFLRVVHDANRPEYQWETESVGAADVSPEFKQRLHDLVYAMVQQGVGSDSQDFQRTLQNVSQETRYSPLVVWDEFRVVPQTDLYSLHQALYGMPVMQEDGNLSEGGWVWQQPGTINTPELTYNQWLLTVTGQMNTLFKQRYGEDKDIDEILENTIYLTEYSWFSEVIRKASAGETDELLEFLTTMPKDRQWIADGFIQIWQKAPGQQQWFGDFMSQYDEQKQLIEAENSIVSNDEQSRVQWVETYLGRKLTSEEKAVVKNFDSAMSADSQNRFQDIAAAYVFYGVSGMSLTENRIESKAQADYEAWLNNPNTPERLKQEFDDFDTLWRHYRQYSEAAWCHSRSSLSPTGSTIGVR